MTIFSGKPWFAGCPSTLFFHMFRRRTSCDYWCRPCALPVSQPTVSNHWRNSEHWAYSDDVIYWPYHFLTNWLPSRVLALLLQRLSVACGRNRLQWMNKVPLTASASAVCLSLCLQDSEKDYEWTFMTFWKVAGFGSWNQLHLRQTLPNTLSEMENEYKPKCSNVLQLCSKDRCGLFNLWIKCVGSR